MLVVLHESSEQEYTISENVGGLTNELGDITQLKVMRTILGTTHLNS
jgi:hypothetical protein